MARKRKPAPVMAQYAATSKERRAMTRLTLGRNTCPGCGVVYVEYRYSVRCEQQHRLGTDGGSS